MKKLTPFFLSAALILSCSTKGHKDIKTVSTQVRCVVTSTHYEYKYGGLTGEKIYYFTTDRGYKVSSPRRVNVGDTVIVNVVSLR